MSETRRTSQQRECRLLSCNKGLTLTEILAVIVVIGILVGLGATMVGPVSRRIKMNRTTDLLRDAREAIVSFAVKQQRLPTETEVETMINLTDAWGKRVLYFHPRTMPPESSPGSDLKAPNALCSSSGSGMSVCTDTTCGNPVDNVAFVLVSGGGTSDGRSNVQSGIIAAPPCMTGRCIRIPPAGSGPIDDYAADMTMEESYDDITVYVTLGELKAKTGCIENASGDRLSR